MMEFLPVVILVTFFWAPIYWIVGGVVFAIIAFTRSLKLRRVRFSTYFTLLSVIMGFGASYGGMRLAIRNGTTCAVDQAGFVDTVSGVIACGILEFSAAGLLGFITLLILGSLLMVLSRAKNQSWVDSDMGLEDAGEVTFENL
jgi:hypothetical protein